MSFGWFIVLVLMAALFCGWLGLVLTADHSTPKSVDALQQWLELFMELPEEEQVKELGILRERVKARRQR